MSFKNCKIQLSNFVSDVFFETGTFHGETARIASDLGFKKVITIELQKYLYDLAKDKSKNYKNIDFYIGDSPNIMREILPKIEGKITFWLDAHIDGGNKNNQTPKIRSCPLYEEIEIISNLKRKDHTILIDDLRIIGKQGWGKSTNLDILKQKIVQINKEYKFLFEDGIVEKDILVAKIS